MKRAKIHGRQQPSIVAGIGKFPQALRMLFNGENSGKVLLDVAGG